MAAQVELGICQGASINCVCARTLVLLLLRAKRERCVPFETVPSFMSIFVRRSCAWWHLVDDVQFCSSGASHAVRPYAITKPRPSLYTYTLIPTVLASVSSYSSSLTEVSCVSINSPSRLPSVNLPFLPSALFNFSLSSLPNLSLYTS